ncbi:MAG: FtsX-like permease family protein, partial [Oscillospiraceae bacterium]|nr:FtsX-like permease family protein [Oscillospiraceae bacterium]
MKLTAKLAYSQIKSNRRRTAWTVLGIALSAAMITAVCGFAASGIATVNELFGAGYAQRDSIYFNTYVGLAAVLGLIIVAVSIVVVSNSFRVSAGERTRQFGILKSVGATKRQITQSVVYEGVFLSAAGTPLGLALGLLVELVGVKLANYFLTSFNILNNVEDIEFGYVIAWQAVVISAAAAVLTTLVSAWLPARRAAKLAAIDAIRQSGEIKLKARAVKTSRLTRALFGFEGTLAAKSLKRSRRGFRATVVSLTVSIVLFIVAGAIGAWVNSVTNLMFPNINATVTAEYISPVRYTYGDNGELAERKLTPLDADVAAAVTAKLREYPGAVIFGVGGDNHSYYTTLLPEMMTEKLTEALKNGLDHVPDYDFDITLKTTDAEHYALLCKAAGVPLGSNILVNDVRYSGPGVGRAEFAPLVFSGQTLHIKGIGRPDAELPLHGELTVGEAPEEVIAQSYGITVIVPEWYTVVYYWYADVADDAGFTEYADNVLRELIPQDADPAPYIAATNIRAATEAVKALSNMVMVFIYGFVGMLTLIGLTNVISTVSA